MPKYVVEFDDGQVVTVDAPLGASDYDIDALALQQLQAITAPPESTLPYKQPVSAPAPAATIPPPRAESTEEEEGILLDTAKGIAQFGIGIPRGVVGLGESVGVGLATLLPEEQELATRDYIKRQAESAREAITPEFYDPEDISSKVGEVLGGTIPFFPAGAAGMAAGRALAARLGASELAGAAVGGAAGAATLGSPAGTAEAVERARAMGVPEDEMTGIALAGAGTGFLEGALPLAMGRLSRLVTDPKIKAALDKLSPQELDSVRENLGVFAANAAKSFGIEGSQEFITAALQNAIAQSYDPEQDIIDMGALEEAALGGTAGAIISATADALLPGRRRGRAELDPKDFENTVRGSSLYDPALGFTFVTEETEAQLKKINPKLFGNVKAGQKLTADQVYALEKAQVVAPVQELEDKPLTAAEQEDVLQQLADAGVDVGAGEPITPAAFTPPEAPATSEQEVVEPTDEDIEDQLRAAALEEEAQTQAAQDAAEETEVAPTEEAGQVTSETTTPEGAPSEPVAAVLEPDVEPGADAEGVEPAADRAGAPDGGPSPVVGRGDGVSDLGVGPEGDTTVAEAPEPGPVEGDGVPVTEPVDGDGEQPGALDAEPAPAPVTATTEAPAAEADVEVEAPVRTPETDTQQVTQLQEADAATLNPSQAAVVTYAPAGKALDTEAIETIAYDAVSQESEAPQGGLSAVAAVQWIRQNGSPEANAQLTKGLARAQKILRGGQTAPQRAATGKLVTALSDPNFNPTPVISRVKKVRELSSLPTALKAPLGRQAIQALRNNNAAEAVRILAESPQTTTRTAKTPRSKTKVTTSKKSPYSPLAKALQPYVGEVNITFVDGLTDADNKPIAGAYDAENNRILLDEKRGKNPHTLLHELSHALTLQAIEEGTLPAVRRLQKIYEEELQPGLGEQYAGTSLKEFASEYQSNPELRTFLASLTSRARVHPARRFGNELMNILRRIMGRATRESVDLPTSIDKMLYSIMQPQAGSPANAALINGTGKERDTYLDRLVKDYFKDSKNLTPEEGRKALLSFADIFKSENNAARARAILTFANGLQLADLFRYFSPQLGTLGRDLHNTFNESMGEMQRIMEQTGVKYRQMMKWRKRNPQKARGVDRVAMLTTLEQVDPTKSRNDYKDDADKLFAYDRIESLWNELGTDGQEQWKLLRKHYQDMFTQLKNVLFQNIDRYVEDGTTAKRLKDEVFSELFSKAELEVYFPLARQGDYWLTYNWGNERVVEAFTTREERAAAMKDIRAEGGKSLRAHGAPRAKQITQSAPPESFVGRTLDILNRGNVNQQTKDQIVELFVDALPETSLIRALQKRKNRLGAIEDTSVAFRQKGYSLARQIGRIKYGNELRAVQNAIDEELDAREGALNTAQEAFAEANQVAESDPNKRNTLARDRARKKLEEKIRRYGAAKMSPAAKDALKAEVNRRVNFAISPPQGWEVTTSKIANQLTFMKTMGLNPASTIVQTAQVPVVNYWDTASRTDPATASKAYSIGLKFYGGAGLTVRSPIYDSEGNQTGVETKIGSNPSIANYYLADNDGTLRIRDDIPPAEKESVFELPLPDGGSKRMTKREFLEYMLPLVQLAKDRGQLGNSMIFELLEINNVLGKDRGGIAGRAEAVLDATTAFMGLGFHNAEMFGRQVTLVANYINELHRLNTKPTTEEKSLPAAERQRYAANEAIYRTEQTNGGSSLVTAPNIAQGGQGLRVFGRTAMMYKSYGFAMYYHQFKSLMQSSLLNSVEDPEVRKASLRALLGTTLAAAMASGVQGVTLVGIIMGAWKAANTAANYLSDEPEEDLIPEELQAEQFFGPLLWNGLPQYATMMLGGELDIAPRIGLSNLIISNSRYQDRGESLADYIAAAALGPSGSVAKSVGIGVKALYDGDRERAIEMLLPNGPANWLRAERYADEGDTTRTGSYIINEYTDMELLGKKMGFAPKRRSDQQFALGAVKTESIAVAERSKKLKQALNTAIFTQDDEAKQRALEAIADFNLTYGKKYPSQLITTEKKAQSWKQFMAGKRKEVGGIQFPEDEFRFLAEEAKNLFGDEVEN